LRAAGAEEAGRRRCLSVPANPVMKRPGREFFAAEKDVEGTA